VASLALLIFVIGLLGLFVEVTSWRALSRIDHGFRAHDPRRAQRGSALRAEITALNACVLRLHLSRDSDEQDIFNRTTQSIAHLIAEVKADADSPEEQRLAGEMSAAYQEFLQKLSAGIEDRPRAVRRDTAAQVHGEITTAAAPLLGLCDTLMDLQRNRFHAFFQASHHSINLLKSLLVISLLLLAGFGTAIVLFIYRARVNPLRSELSATQQTIEQKERLASLGVLAAGIAHEIRNPLTAVKFRLFSLKKSLPAAWAGNEDLHLIGTEIHRLERIVKSFLEFARPGHPEMTEVTAHNLLQEVKTLLQPELEKRNIALEVEAPEELRLRADPQQIQQVLINLVQNAAESIQQNGKITLRAKSGVTNRRKQSVPMTMIQVADNGKGIPAEVERKIFDPFFSTKETGTGMGLSIAARIVENHGGIIQYETRQNAGTTFSITLPRESNDAHENIDH